ncbi:MAG: hypothetical protein JNM94_00885 [Phycisphaerae bacterium]|nr:hypothetical protein [Phycisphaerae bacterium]
MRVMHVVAALLVAIACACAPARGQGTSGAVPEPISTTELHDLLRRYVAPTREEWDAIEGLHDDYRASFKQLREGDIEKLLESQRAIEGTGFPRRDKFEKLIRDTERVTKRIGEIDGTLFEGIAVVVGEDKRQGVTRAANARLRQRELRGGSMSAMGMMNATDMSPIVIDSFADAPEVLATITPDLIDYEERLTASAKGAGEDALSMWTDMFRELEKAGFAEMTEEDMRNNPERMTALMETAQRAMQEAGKKVQKRVQAIRELNDRTYRGLSAKLTGDPQRRLRAVYLRRAHPMIGYDTSFERLFASLEKSATISPELKERLRVERTNFVQANDAIIDQLVKLDNERTESSDLFNPFGGGGEELQKKLQELQTKRAELQERTASTLRPMVGDERYDRIFQRLAMAGDSANPFATIDVDATDEAVAEAAAHEASVEATVFDAGRSLSPLDVGMIQLMSGSMNLDAGMKSTLETMHADYQKTWTDSIAPLLEEVAKQEGNQWTRSEDGSMRWNAEAISAHAAKQREAVAKALDLDEAFFADVLKVLGESHANEILVVRLDRVTMMRQLRPDLFGSGFAFGDEEVAVPIMTILSHESIPDDARPAARAAVAAAAATAIPRLRELDVAAMENATQTQNLGMSWGVQFQDGQPPDAAAMAKFQEESMKLQTKAEELRRERQKIMTSIFEAMKSAIPEANRDAFQLAYDKAAFPSIFNDPRTALPFLDRASALPDLTPDQRARLDSVRAEYERDYFDACRRMVRRNPSPPKASNDPSAVYREYAARQNERMKVQFERDERSARAVSQVRRVLTDEQIKQVPGLGEYEQNLKGQSNGGFPYPLE